MLSLVRGRLLAFCDACLRLAAKLTTYCLSGKKGLAKRGLDSQPVVARFRFAVRRDIPGEHGWRMENERKPLRAESDLVRSNQ